MSPIEREMHALRALASGSGTAARTMHDAVSSLKRSGLVAAVPHATDLIAPTHRLPVADRGFDRLAWEPGVDVLVDWSLLTPREMSGMLGWASRRGVSRS